MEPAQHIGTYRRAFHILVVDEDQALRRRVEILLRKPGYSVRAVDTLDEAAAVLRREPIDLVVCAAQHGADEVIPFLRRVRAGHRSTATLIVACDAERVASLEAWRHRFTALSHPLNAGHFQAVVEEKLQGISRRQRWPRKQVSREVALRVGTSRARLLDVSYGGLRFEINAGEAPLASPLRIEVERHLQVDAAVVWSAAVSEGYCYLFGAAVVTEPPDAWRRFVDGVA